MQSHDSRRHRRQMDAEPEAHGFDYGEETTVVYRPDSATEWMTGKPVEVRP